MSAYLENHKKELLERLKDEPHNTDIGNQLVLIQMLETERKKTNGYRLLVAVLRGKK